MNNVATEDFLRQWNDPNDYIVAQTSGSTGAPKLIQISKHDMRLSARATNDFFGIKAGNVLFLPLSPDYIAGKMMIVRALEADAKLISVSPSNDFVIDEAMLEGKKVKLAAIVPSQVRCLAEKYADLVENVIVGGAPMSQSEEDMLAQSGINAYQTYGMTETVSHVALRKIGDDNKLYRAMPGISFSTHNGDLLAIDAPEFNYRRVETNDRVHLVDEHTFQWLGRADNVINSGGVKIQMEDIESLLQPHIPYPFCVAKQADEKWGERPVLIVEAEQNAYNEHFVRNTINKILPKIKRPNEVRFVEKLPRTSNGKIRRQFIS